MGPDTHNSVSNTFTTLCRAWRIWQSIDLVEWIGPVAHWIEDKRKEKKLHIKMMNKRYFLVFYGDCVGGSRRSNRGWHRRIEGKSWLLCAFSAILLGLLRVVEVTIRRVGHIRIAFTLRGPLLISVLWLRGRTTKIFYYSEQIHQKTTF